MIMLASEQNTIRRAHRRSPGLPLFALLVLTTLLQLCTAGCGTSAQSAADASGPASAKFDAITIAALTAFDQDQFDVAEKQFQAALDITQPWPEGDLRIPLTLINLGSAQTYLEHYAAADASFDRALKLLTTHHPDDFDNRGDAEFRRGELYRLQHDADNADRWLNQADKTLAQSPSHPAFLQAKICHALAKVALELRGQAAVAQPLFKRSLDFMDQSKQTETIDMCVLLNNYAACHLHLKDAAAAEPLLTKAWTIEQAHFAGERVAAETALGLGQLAYFDSKYADAETMFQKAYDYFVKNLGPEAPYTVRTLSNLAESQLANNHRDAGIASYETLATVLINAKTEGTPEQRQLTAIALGKLALLYQKNEKYEPALTNIDKLLAFYAKFGDPDAPATGEALAEKSHILEKLGRTDEAKAAADQAAAIRAKNPPAPAPAK